MGTSDIVRDIVAQGQSLIALQYKPATVLSAFITGGKATATPY